MNYHSKDFNMMTKDFLKECGIFYRCPARRITTDLISLGSQTDCK